MQMAATFMLSAIIRKKPTEHLAKDFQTVINWFYENYMILNTEKCHYMCVGKDVDENETLQF